MDLKELYDQIGGNYQETISRLPSEPMVKKFVLKYPADPTYAQLQAAIAQKDWETAFRAAHTLKGLAANLGLVQLWQAASALTEALRVGDMQSAAALYPETAAAYRQAYAAIGDLDTDA